MNWTQPNALRNHYWESEKFDFWIVRRPVWYMGDQKNSMRFYLFNGDNELGRYNSLQEAQNAAEPAHGLHEDKESDPVCYWCQGSHPGEICKNAPYYVEGAQ